MTARALTPARILAGVAVLAGIALALAPPIAGMSWRTQATAALTLASIALWATAAIPELVTALLFFLLAILLNLAEPAVVLSGFSSTAFWLVFGGLVVGVAVKDTGLGGRLARALAGQFGASYLGLIGGLVGVGLALGFIMPSSTGRIVLLLPITMALAERFGFRPGSNGYNGMVMASCYGAFVLPFTILPANIPNLVLVGAAQQMYGVELTYGRYLLAHFPVMGLLKGAVAALVIAWLLPDRPRVPEEDLVENQRMSHDEWILAAILAGSLALWVTDFLHHVSPAWVSLGAAVLCMLPGINLVSVKAFNEKIAFGTMFYVGGVIGIGALVDASGLGKFLATQLLAVAPLAPGEPAMSFAVIVGLSTLIGLVTMLPGLPAVTAPLCGHLAEAAGLPVEAVLLMQGIAYSTLLLPYQGPPLVIGQQIAGIRAAIAAKVCLVVGAATVAVLLPLDYFWWRLVGLL